MEPRTSPAAEPANDPINVAGDTGPVTPSEILIGSGQGVWLAAVTVIAVLALVVAFVALVIASDEDGATTVTPTTVAAATELSVTTTEFKFEPTSWTAKAGTEVTVTLENAGNLPHEWAVLEAGTTITEESEFTADLVVARVPITDPGKTATATINLAAGTYQVICSVPGHFLSGMQGTLGVR